MFIVLGAPHSQFAVLFYLSVENTLHTFVECGTGALAKGIRYIGVRGFLAVHITQQVHDVHHCIVVVGDVGIIAFGARPELRPAAVGVLRF